MNDITPNGFGAGAEPPRPDALAVRQSGGALAMPLDPAAIGEPTSTMSVSEVWRTIVKWRWLILAMGLAGIAGAVAITLMTTPLYRTAATIEIKDEPTKIVTTGDLQPVKRNAQDDLATQVGILQSRSLAERTARQLNLASNDKFTTPGAPRAAREEQAASTILSGLQVNPVRTSRLVTISYTSTDPTLAASVANGIADNFISSNLERKFETTAYARDFLQKRIASVKTKLEESERQLVNYARREGIIEVPTGGNGPNQSTGSLTTATLVSLNEALSLAQTQRIEAEQRLRQASGASATAAAVNNSTLQNMRADLAKLESQYQENLNVYKPDYPAMVRLQQQIGGMRASIAREGSRISGSVSGELAANYRAAVARENQLAAKVSSLKTNALDLRDRSIQYTILQREVDTNRTLYDGLLQRFKEVGVAGGVGENLVAIIDRAEVPGGPFKPNLILNLLMGIFAGLGLGVAAAFAKEFIDDKIETPDDVEHKLGLRPMGVIPKIPSKDRFVNLLGDPRSPVFEAYQSTVTSLRFSTSEGAPRTLLVTSSRPSEGKSSSALALAQAFARQGNSVVLIDADMRMPTFMPTEEGAIGLSNLLTGDNAIDRAIFSARLDNLFFLPSGPIPPNPAELLAGPRMREVVDDILKHFDMVVIDGPPVLGLADAPLLGTVAKGVIMIFESGGIRRHIARNAIARMRGSRSNVVGAILTKYKEKRAGYGATGYDYGYGYGYGYGAGAQRDGEAGRRLIDLSTQ